jgi:hypothetical protein
MSYSYSYDHLFAGLSPSEFLSDCRSEDRSALLVDGVDHPESRSFLIRWVPNDPWVFKLSEVFIDKWYRLRTDLPVIHSELRRAVISNPNLAVLAIRYYQKTRVAE